jgi:hypothetical protein
LAEQVAAGSTAHPTIKLLLLLHCWVQRVKLRVLLKIPVVPSCCCCSLRTAAAAAAGVTAAAVIRIRQISIWQLIPDI